MPVVREYSNPMDEIREIERQLGQTWLAVSDREKGRNPKLRQRMKEIRHQLTLIRELRDSLWGQLNFLKKSEQKNKK